LARSIVALEIPLDVSRLYESGDRSFLIWVRALVDRVADDQRQQRTAMEADS
jgi:hypothetical protein